MLHKRNLPSSLHRKHVLEMGTPLIYTGKSKQLIDQLRFSEKAGMPTNKGLTSMQPEQKSAVQVADEKAVCPQ